MTNPIFGYNIGIMNPNISYINRDLEDQIKENLGSGKVIVIYGPRRVGKTTLIKHIFEKGSQPFLYLSCEQTRIRESLVPDELRLKEIIGKYQNIVFDEAQYLENPGLILKILIDTFPNLNIIASGSSSFELANQVQEPLTGRNLQYCLFPLTWNELYNLYSPINISFYLEQTFRFGSYPETLKYPANEEKMNYLQLLTDDYLYKDILVLDRVKESKKLRELLVLLSLQIGSEVSYHELANTLGIDKKTVERFIDLLEKTFVIFRLYAFSRNLRSEINRKVKVYFYDLGVRNALINNLNPLELRADKGAIFENYVIAELIKHNSNRSYKSGFYFWRTYEKREIDLVEEREGKLFGFEIKYSNKKTSSKLSRLEFKNAYPNSTFGLINKDNLNEIFRDRFR